MPSEEVKQRSSSYYVSQKKIALTSGSLSRIRFVVLITDIIILNYRKR